jgi:hypothetical protein
MATEDADFEDPAMTPEELSQLIEVIRDPKSMLRIFEHPLGDLVYDILKADGTPDAKMYSDHHIIGMLTALRPLLTARVNSVFALPAAELALRERLLVKEKAYEAAWYAENEPAGDCDPSPEETAMSAAHEALRTATFELSIAERRRLALDLVIRPEAMIRDGMAVVALQHVLNLTYVVEFRTRDEVEAYCVALNGPGRTNLLRVLRDLRRTLK